jgi:calcium-dependent protein kinase
MLKTNPDHRPNAHDLLQHPYFTNQKLAQVGIFSTNFIQYEDDETLVM